MGVADEIYVFVCGSCDATYTGRPHELAKLGWISHPYARPGMRRKHGDFLLCEACEKHYASIWKAREERKAA
jgi:hypothetical protein